MTSSSFNPRLPHTEQTHVRIPTPADVRAYTEQLCTEEANHFLVKIVAPAMQQPKPTYDTSYRVSHPITLKYSVFEKVKHALAARSWHISEAKRSSNRRGGMYVEYEITPMIAY